MANAISAKYKIAYVKETTPGTTPAAALTLLRFNSADGQTSASSATSDEISLVEIPDVIRTGIKAGGSIDGEVSYGVLDDFIETIFGNAWSTNVLTVGNTKKTLTIEEQYTDIGVYLPYKSAVISALSLNVANGAKITYKSTWDSFPPTPAATTAGTGGPTAAPTNTIMDPVGSVQLAQEGGSGSLITTGFTAFTIDFVRPTILQPTVGSLVPVQVDSSRFEAKGTLSLYVPDSATLTKYLNNTLTSLALTLGGASAIKYAFLFNKVRLTGGGINALSKDQPAVQTYQWQAIYDSTNTTCKITRTP